ncbi:MAG: helix-turn-helix domain-containing protein [Pseudomonadota bacterium]
MPQQERVKSADRVLALLELFERRRKPLSASEVANVTNWPLSSTAALLKSLVQSRYLMQVENGRKYYPSIRLHNLTRWLGTELLSSGESVHDLLSTLLDQFGETITLSVRRGLAMEFVEILLGTKRAVMKVQEGDTFDLFGSAIGIAALAATDDGKIEELLKRARRIQPDVSLDRETILGRVESCRELGYYTGYDHAIEGLGAIALPLTAAGTASTYVIAVAGLSSQIRHQDKEIARDAQRIIAAYQGN